jgi:pyruvate dehydrogenase E2 component (dihydrolipoamide acetyltransferase)
MPREINMPKLSDTMEEGTINVWRKGEGDEIARGDVLVEIETDKADMEFEAYMAGTLAKVLVPAGETVAVGVPIAVVRLPRDTDEELEAFLAERGGEAAPQAAAKKEGGAPAGGEAEASERPAPAAKPAKGGADEEPPARGPAREGVRPAPLPMVSDVTPTSKIPFFLPDPDRVRATPAARARARERDVDLSEIAGTGPDAAVRVADVDRYLESLAEAEAPLEGDVPITPVAARIADELEIDVQQVKGTGPGGRVTKRDLRAHLERLERGEGGREAALHGDEIKLSQKRKALIRNMVKSKEEVPHFYIAMDVDVEPLRALRERLKEDGKPITYTHLIVKACALALEHFPDVNATFRDGRIVRYQPVNVAVAVDVQGELVAPVVKDCQGRSVADLARETDALIARAREKKLSPEDYADGTFTLSNLGMLGVDHFYAIITPPQSTVLSVSAMRRVPVAEGDQIRVGYRMDFGLACDHRVLDGAKAAEFLAEIRRLLESPADLLKNGNGLA